MDFTNATPLTSQLAAGAPDGLELSTRLAMLTAKATFNVGLDGSAQLETQAPVECLTQDQETPLGLLPRDDLARPDDDVFEVILLGAAYAPRGRPAREVSVRLSVGDVARELVVIGDRSWKAGPAAVRPFERMPMTWSRAFGGTAAVEIDRGAFVDVGDPRNREGVGFDPAASARSLGEQLGCPEGYPVVAEMDALPNLERPDARIARREDAPEPACWATLGLQSGLAAERFMAEHQRRGLAPEELADNPALLYRASPDWVIPMPERGARVALENATPDGSLELRLPELRVLADYRQGPDDFEIELAPQRLLLLPEERRFTLTFGRAFRFTARPGEERALRLRLAAGWYSPGGRDPRREARVS